MDMVAIAKIETVAIDELGIIRLSSVASPKLLLANEVQFPMLLPSKSVTKPSVGSQNIIQYVILVFFSIQPNEEQEKK